MSEYKPDDRSMLGPSPWKPTDPALQAWEQAHGHDVRLDCDVEGCPVQYEADIAEAHAAGVKEQQEKRSYEWDCPNCGEHIASLFLVARLEPGEAILPARLAPLASGGPNAALIAAGRALDRRRFQEEAWRREGPLPRRLYNTLLRADLEPDHVRAMSITDLVNIRNLGPKSARYLKDLVSRQQGDG